MKGAAFPGGMEIQVLDHRVHPNKLPPSQWERAYVEAILGHLHWGMVVYDIGAEEGEYTALWARHVGPRSVHIIEPAPWYWPNIRAVWEANVTGFPGGTFAGFLADKARSKVTTDGWPAESRTDPPTKESAFACYAEHPHLPAVTLDDYVAASQAPPDVLTIDVEGAEHLVLQGAALCLEEIRPEVFMAVHRPEFLERYHSSQEGIFRYMGQLGYHRKLIAEELHETHYQFTPRELIGG